MKRLTSYLTAALAALALSCTAESEKSTYATQESNIDSFVEARLAESESAYAVSNKGVRRVVTVPGSGDPLSAGGTVSFYYAGYVMSGSSISASGLFATNHEETANAAGWTASDDSAFQPVTATLKDAGFVSGLTRGLEGVMAGEECYILFSGKYGFGKKQIGTIPANSALAYHIWVESISNE